MRYLVIAYDKNSVCVNRLAKGETPSVDLKVEDVLCQGSSFNDVVHALAQAFQKEMEETE